jgi:hypothetical protein
VKFVWSGRSVSRISVEPPSTNGAAMPRTTAQPDSQQSGDRRVAYAAALWAAIFAAFHVIWAAGWYPLLDAEQARIAFATTWKWAYDLVVAVMCVIAVPVALAPVVSWGRHVPRGVIFTLAMVGSSLLILRSAASMVQIGYFMATGRFRVAAIGIWEPWFYLGAVLFGVSTWRSRHAQGESHGRVS